MGSKTQEEQLRIFSKNLRDLVYESGKTQAEIASSIGVSPQRFSTWYKGISIPRMTMVQALASYFNVSATALIDDPNEYDEEETDIVITEDDMRMLIRMRCYSKNQMRLLKAYMDALEKMK